MWLKEKKHKKTASNYIITIYIIRIFLYEKEKHMNNDRTYSIAADNTDDLLYVLENEFNLSEERAKLLIALSYESENNKFKDEQDANQIRLWNLNQDNHKQQSIIFKTRLTVSFTNTLLNTLNATVVDLFMNYITGCISIEDGYKFIIVFIMNLINNSYIIQSEEDDFYEYNVFKGILHFKESHDCKNFVLQDIIDSNENLKEEDYADIEETLNKLCEKNVLIKNDADEYCVKL